MILIGQYDSPFVRRVAIAATLYDISFEHRPWSTFGDAEQIRRYNPLLRVPTLVRDDGSALVESGVILDYLDHRVPEERALIARGGAARHEALRVIAFATGVADKAVSLFYELRFHDVPSGPWVERARGQVRDTLAVLERERAARRTAWWFGDQIGHADIAVAAALRFLSEAHPDLHDPATSPALAETAAAAESQPVFQTIYQRFDAPPRR